jgi:hypothetical protein
MIAVKFADILTSDARQATPVPVYFSALSITCVLQRRSVPNKTQMQANKLQFRGPGLEDYPVVAAAAMIIGDVPSSSPSVGQPTHVLGERLFIQSNQLRHPHAA